MATVKAVRDRLMTQVGYTEGPKNNQTTFGQWYGLNFEPWCAMFQSWGYFQEGMPLKASTSKGFALVEAGVQWAKKNGLWVSATAGRVEVGWLACLWYDSLGRHGHIGHVANVFGDRSFKNIEGNTNGDGSRDGGAVEVRHRAWSSMNKGGFITPVYDKPTGDNTVSSKGVKLIRFAEDFGTPKDGVYMVVGGSLFPFSSVEAFTAAGYTNADVDTVSKNSPLGKLPIR